MALAKRKRSAETSDRTDKKLSKKTKVPDAASTKKPTKKASTSSKSKPVKRTTKNKSDSPEDLDESDTTESENGYYGFSAKTAPANGENEHADDESGDEDEVMNGTSEAETHFTANKSKEVLGDGTANANCKFQFKALPVNQ